VFSDRDDTVSTVAVRADNQFSSQITGENEKSEKYVKILAQSNPHSNKNEITQKNLCYINNYYSQKAGKVKDIFNNKNNVIPMYCNEKSVR